MALSDHRPSKAELLAAVGRRLPDVMGHDLKVLFCGINPGLYSAAVGHHFARPGNRFWTALHAAGFTRRVLRPSENRQLLDRGYGLTDLVARATAKAEELAPHELVAGRRRLQRKVRRYRPRWVAVLGIGAYRVAFRSPDARPGPQAERIAGARIWVLPNPSGLNAGHSPAALADAFRMLRRRAMRMVVRPRVGRLFLGVLAMHLASRPAHSQTVAPGHRFEIGATGGLSFIGVAGAKSGGRCGGLATSENPTVGVRGGYKLTKGLGVEVTLESIRDNPVGLTVLCAPPPQPRAGGPDTLRTDVPTWEVGGFHQSTATTARVVLTPWSVESGELRVYAGVGRVWQRHLLPIIVGLNGRLKTGRVSLIGETEGARSAVPFTHESRFYQDGVLLRTESVADRKPRLDFTIRFGIAVSL